jgi:glutathione S-transferase
VFPAAVPIFTALATGNAEQVSSLFAEMERQLLRLERVLDARAASAWHACGNTLTTADGALAPFLFYVDVLGKTCERTALSACPRLQRFWEGAQSHAVLSTAVGEIAQAMAAARERASA